MKSTGMWMLIGVLASSAALAETAVETAVEAKSDAPAPSVENFKYTTVTTPEGLTFRVPEDMPIEKRNGIVAPIPFDEYMYGKFRQMDARMSSIEARLGRIEELLLRLVPGSGGASAPSQDSRQLRS